jgi:hypothetical protein
MRTVRKVLFAFTILLSLFIQRSALSEPLYLLKVESLNTGKILFHCSLSAGDRFFIDYIHSSDKTPVQDIFEISGEGTLVLIEERFSWYGAGLEHLTWEKASVVYEKDCTRVLLHREFPSLRLRVGRVAQHRLTVRGTAIFLRDIARGGELLEIRAEPIDPS